MSKDIASHYAGNSPVSFPNPSTLRSVQQKQSAVQTVPVLVPLQIPPKSPAQKHILYEDLDIFREVFSHIETNSHSLKRQVAQFIGLISKRDIEKVRKVCKMFTKISESLKGDLPENNSNSISNKK